MGFRKWNATGLYRQSALESRDTGRISVQPLTAQLKNL
jgi:hypothetical protein